ncbi:hypothetical protein BDN70DRAFT_896825, partial [Pholiota conissans]
YYGNDIYTVIIREMHVDIRFVLPLPAVGSKAIREKNAQEKAERLIKLNLVLDKKKLPDLKGQNLQDQYALFKAQGAPNMQTIKKPTKVGEIRQLLSDAIDLQSNGEWKLEDDKESDSEGEGSTDDEENHESEVAEPTYDEESEDDWEDV